MNLLTRIKSALEFHGCLTGDCPHEKQNECFYSVVQFFLEYEAEQKQDIEVYGLKKYSSLEISSKELQDHRNGIKAINRYFNAEDVNIYQIGRAHV